MNREYAKVSSLNEENELKIFDTDRGEWVSIYQFLKERM